MLRFDQLQLDCNDHLLIYDGAHPIGNYKVLILSPIIDLIRTWFTPNSYYPSALPCIQLKWRERKREKKYPAELLVTMATPADRFFTNRNCTSPGAHPVLLSDGFYSIIHEECLQPFFFFFFFFLMRNTINCRSMVWTLASSSTEEIFTFKCSVISCKRLNYSMELCRRIYRVVTLARASVTFSRGPISWRLSTSPTPGAPRPMASISSSLLLKIKVPSFILLLWCLNAVWFFFFIWDGQRGRFRALLQVWLFLIAESFCRDFRCAQKDFCISTDLLCDGVNHCGDNTDESTSSLCAG